MASFAPASVDRTSERWQRIRAACQQAADYIDLDLHADNVCATVESYENTNGHRPHSLDGSRAADGQLGAS